MIQKVRIAIGAVAALLLLSFIIQNFGRVPVKFWPFLEVSAPLWIIVAGSAALGVLAFYFFLAIRKSKTPKP